MQNTSSYYAVPQCDGGIWADWQHSGRGENQSSWGASTSSRTTRGGPSSSRRTQMKDTTQYTAVSMSYSLTPPTPSATDSDASSSSQISMDSIPEYDEMPEIPFVSAAIAYSSGWASSDRPPEQAQVDDDSPQSFWTGLIGLRPSASKSSATSSSLALPSTPPSPSRTTRKRAGSVSSIASSRTRPAPAKSILSSSESVRTRRRGAPSVKFLDVPTIHYEEDDYHDDYDHDHDPGRDAREPGATCLSPPPPKKARGLSGFFSFKWLFGSSSSSSTPPPSTSSRPPGSKPGSGRAKTKKGVVPGRPTISGPFPLCETATAPRPHPRGGSSSSSSAASLRSVKSGTSLRSVRSCGSRLPTTTTTYWPR